MRFDGIQRIYGPHTARLSQAHVAVVGVGGVGSWVVEALARSGIGRLTLIDPDDVCVSNTNRQIQALTEHVGRAKVDVLAERIASIHPDCQCTPRRAFFREATATELLDGAYDYVVDAIDGVMPKAGLIARCVQQGIPVITCGGSGGKRDPAQIRIIDLADTYNDRLLAFIRKKLRHVFDFPAEGSFGVPCVFSPEPALWPAPDTCNSPTPDWAAAAGSALNCDGRLGALTFVTGTFGFHAAAHVVNHLTQPT
jgi:tRNA threonylcarbamoyladenosine dehydratase